MTGGRVVVAGRRGTLVLSTERRLAHDELDEMVRQLTAGLARPSARVLVLDGCRVEAVIPAGPRRPRAGRRPRWAR